MSTSPPTLDKNKTDIESQSGIHITPVDNAESSTSATPTAEEVDLGESNVPKLSLPHLFWFFFYNFGLFAWGGPVAQIALIKDRLVIKDQWISLERFQRVFAVYQILPGPEAAELCMFFGCLSNGRLGGIVAGLAFILPGFVLMLVASYVYSLAGMDNKWFNASFRALQPVVAAMIFRATHKIADHSLHKPESKKTDPFLVIIAICTMINSALRLNILISLALYGVIYTLISRRLWIPAAILFLAQYIGYTLYVIFHGIPSPVSLALGIAPTPSLLHLFLLGLVAGTLSFGGAYTAIPFIQVEAVLKGGWLSQRVFIDCIAIGNVLPAPLVIFATFVGFQGGMKDGGLGVAFAGAVIITLGMFFPCFVFTIAGHKVLEKLVYNKFLAPFFTGLCASVIGVIAVIAFQILKPAIEGSMESFSIVPTEHAIQKASESGIAAVLYAVSLGVLYKFSGKWVVVVMVVVAAVSGQFLFI
ncbi:chromate transporter [Lindgomyces ingoldianus]|uniref:Chromate transporter n=1 Tax=Lindgomyces ingoldianus TaxID=673940 RepID=A0ACB6RGL8_9PLEO|nr:chromate transporter [Lindgomyces ingoldianus]KAF2477485.1 chromate transporter [Lindgomyces ingoldianus]